MEEDSSQSLLTDDDIAAALRVLRSSELAGPDHAEVVRLEQLLGHAMETSHAVATNSGTAAIHSILLALGVGPGDEVIVPAQTFIATATPVLMCSATPVVVDIEPESHCVDPKAVADAAGSKTKAVIAVHLNGHPAAVDALPKDIPVVSDACQAMGARLFGRSAGGLGVASAVSFWQDKLITAAGEGGAICSSDRGLVDEVRLIRSHGQAGIPGTPHSHHVRLGYNYRMTGVQAAVAGSQLTRLEGIVQQRRKSAHLLTERLRGIPALTLPTERDGATHAYWKYVVAVDLDQLKVTRDAVVHALRAEGLPAIPRYPIPLFRQPVLESTARFTPCPVAEAAADRLMTLPLPAAPEETNLEDIARTVRKVLTAYRR